MGTKGIEGLMIETTSWKDTAAFWTALGFEIEYETEQNSGRLRHPAGGPYIFAVERSEGAKLEVQPVVGLDSADGFEPPASAEVAVPFKDRPWGAQEMLVRDADGRRISIQAPKSG